LVSNEEDDRKEGTQVAQNKNPVEQMLENKIVPLQLFYKTVSGLPEGETLGCKTYLNVNSMDSGILAPDDYRYVAKRTIQCEQLAEKNITKVMRILHNGEGNGIKGWVSIQVPDRMLKGGKLIDLLTSLIRRYPKASANKMCLEFNSDVFFSEFDMMKSEIEKLKELGFKIGFDEVGTEYFPLMKLQQLPVDIVFMDKSVNENMDTETEEKTVGSLVAFLMRLNVQVIAMGLTEEKMKSAERAGCTGYCGRDYDGIFPPITETEED
jgi:EAL domain-containing protein (putative c-di-GMP-specific phosphodiesterase class I)